MKFATISSLLLALFCSGCLFTNAPDVSIPRQAVKSPVTLGLEPLCTPNQAPEMCGNVTMTLAASDDHWGYWKAGTAAMVYQPAPEFVTSDAWDLRITKYFPLVGSNGGKTAADEGLPTGRAAFAVIADSRGRFVPSSAAEVLDLDYVDDRYESIEFDGVKLGAEYQNMLLNTIGSGLLRSYSLRDHSVQLSYRVFILRTVDGLSYYALRFSGYSRGEKTFSFEWRKL